VFVFSVFLADLQSVMSIRHGLFSFLHLVCGLKSVDLMIFSLNQS